MSHPLFFRGITYFYPLGNTSAVRLTEHLPPEHQARVLLLACGDPRHILYTVHTNSTTDSDLEPQKLDVTCCDLEPAVLARNALLFTLLADAGAQQRLDQIWNVFYHYLLDPESLSLLVEQCRKLATLATDLASWQAGPYARVLTVCDQRTLAALGKCWRLCAATADYATDERKRYQKNFVDGMKRVSDRFSDAYVFGSARSAGPLLPLAVTAIAEQFRTFWSRGVTDDGLRDTTHATLVNPTFTFSAAREQFAVHYGTDPAAGFHLADVVATCGGETPAVLAQKVVRAARSEFSEWCTSVIQLLSVTTTSPTLVVRLFAGDALMLCQAFSHLNVHGAAATPILTSPWTASRIEFEESLYGEGAADPAPTTFNVIDTSNLSDHVGLLNLLVVTTPILSKSPSATLYTESLLSYGDEASTGLLERLCGDLQTMSLLLGVVPSAFLSRFTTRSNVHEMMLQATNPSALQYHEQVVWKAIDGKHLATVAADQLGRLLFQVYLNMFSDESMTRQLQNLSVSRPRAMLQASLVHYTRQSFAQLLRHVQSRVYTEWTAVMDKFDDLVGQDSSLILGSNFYQEMCAHLHLLDAVTFDSMKPSCIERLRVQTGSDLFKDWASIPPLVTIVLAVPRNKMVAVEPELRQAGTPALLCEIRNASLWNMFADISAAYGRLDATGTGDHARATIVADEEEASTSAPLIVWFVVPSSSLLLSRGATVGFRTRPSPRAYSSAEAIFAAPLQGSRHVHMLAEPPMPPGSRVAVKDARPAGSRDRTPTLTAQVNAMCTEIGSFMVRVDITDPAGQASLAAGAAVEIKPALNHGARVCMDGYAKTIDFPLPVDVTNTKLRVARKAKYIELIAPLATSMDVQHEQSMAKRFVTPLEGGVPTPWNVHRVHLDRCPRLNASKSADASKWLIPHVSLMFSGRERAVRGTPSTKDTLVHLKDSLHTLLLSAAGVEGRAHAVFALQHAPTGRLFAFLCVAELRLDLGAHTVVADAWVAPATTAVRDKLRRVELPDVLAIKLDDAESEAWRYLLPALVERCRTWSHRPGCAYAVHGVPLFPDAGADPERMPFCACGVGVGTGALPERFGAVSGDVTRAAIGPLFAVSYLEPRVGMPPCKEVGCSACGKQGRALSVCGRCKGVKYCSKACQVRDWKVHKKNCAR